MIDRPARIRMAELLRHLAGGELTLGEFARAAPKEGDDVAIAGARALVNRWYALLLHREAFRRIHQNQTQDGDDRCLDCRLEGDNALTPAQLRVADRLILFLHSDLEYEWNGQASKLASWQARSRIPLAFLVIALWGAVAALTSPQISGLALLAVAGVIYVLKGSQRVWPFRRRSDYNAALASDTRAAHR